jgi:trimeric autotransporter adhesin
MLARRQARLSLFLVAGSTVWAGCSDLETPSPVMRLAVVETTTGQEARTGTPLPRPLAVIVTADGQPAPGVTVHWLASAGTLGRATVVTGGDGQATSAWTLGTDPGVQTASASVDEAQGSPATFTARALEWPAEPPPAPTPTELLVSPADALLDVGESRGLGASVAYSDGSQGQLSAVTWSSTNASIVSVTSDGTVTGVAPGHARIRASADGLSATAEITVAGPVVSVTVIAEPAFLVVGDGLHWEAQARDAAGSLKYTAKATWSSSAAGVAFVQPNGFIIAVAPGTATISATVEGVTGSAEVTVLAPVNLAGAWSLAEEWTLDDYPPGPSCTLEGPVTLEQTGGSVAISGTYGRNGSCPQRGGGSLDLTGTVTLEGTIAGSVVELESHAIYDCAYRGTVDRVTWERISGSVTCAGRPGTAQADQVYYGSFTLSK